MNRKGVAPVVIILIVLVATVGAVSFSGILSNKVDYSPGVSGSGSCPTRIVEVSVDDGYDLSAEESMFKKFLNKLGLTQLPKLAPGAILPNKPCQYIVKVIKYGCNNQIISIGEEYRPYPDNTQDFSCDTVSNLCCKGVCIIQNVTHC